MSTDNYNPYLSPFTFHLSPNRIIAICGGIGVGKSQVSARLRALGYHVIDADKINKELLGEKEYLAKLAAAFPDCLGTDGNLDKGKLKSAVFSDDSKRKTLNAIAHPEIIARIAREAVSLGGVVFVEVPLFIESGLCAAYFDGVWAVVADKDKRIERIVKRDGVTAEFAEKMIDAQSREEKAELAADTVIENNGGLDDLMKRVNEAARTLSDAK